MKTVVALFAAFLCSVPAAAEVSQKFQIFKFASLDEGAYCTRNGWAYTEQVAMERARHAAKVACVLEGDWQDTVELDMYCLPDCTEAYGTVTDCEAWYQCTR